MNFEMITFHDFMYRALYDPKGGYYQKEHPVFGARGDFTTAPELTPLFAQTLADQVVEIADALKQEYSLMEIGGGQGKLAETILEVLQEKKKLPKKCIMVEASLHLQSIQKQRLKKFQNSCAIEWHTEIPNKPFVGIILANELIDALPVHRIRIDDTISEWYVEQKNESWTWALGPLSSPVLSKKIKNLLSELGDSLPLPYDTEINLAQEQILKRISEILVQGVSLFIDYGFSQSVYYHPDRAMGTLIGHHRHLTEHNPLLHVGSQDLTAHVDFTKLAQDTIDVGLEILGFTTQANFLISLNILSKIKTVSPADNHAIQMLIEPHEMGELFKVLAIGKNYDHALKGFHLRDLTHTL